MNLKLRHAAVAALLVSITMASHAGFESLLGAVKDVTAAVTVSESDIVAASRQMVDFEDRKQKIAPPGSKYAKRMADLTASHVNEDGLKLNFKVYLSPTVNAFAAADGSIRFYSGLMDLMSDDELRGIIGHEIAHVKLGHSMATMKTAYMASAARKAAGNADGALGAVAKSEMGGMLEAVLNAQFSQSQETSADDYGLAFLQKYKHNVKAMESAFLKLAMQQGRGGASIMASHPDPASRAERMKHKTQAH